MDLLDLLCHAEARYVPCQDEDCYDRQKCYYHRHHEAIKKIESNKKSFLYLYRNPFKVIYSYILFNLTHSEYKKYDYYGNEERAFSDEVVRKHIQDLKKYNSRFLKNNNCILLKYENFMDKNKRLGEFKKICDFLGYEFYEEKIQEIFEKSNGTNFSDLSETREERNEYERKRKIFEDKWKEEIEREFE